MSSGVNRLFALIERDGDRSIANLKRRYRLLCKEAHPDLAARGHAGRHEAFLILNEEYRAALTILRTSNPAAERAALSQSEARSLMLDRLRTYAFKFYNRDSEAQLEELIRAAADYDPKRARLLRSYKAVFLDSYHSWLSDGRVYYAHAVLVAAVRQLFHYRDTGSPRHALLLERYSHDARERSGKLSGQRFRVVGSFLDWIREEAAGGF